MELARTEWSKILTKEGVPFFSNKNCVAGDGPFSSIAGQSKRLAIRQELLEACRTSIVTAVGVTIDLSEFKTVLDTPEKVKRLAELRTTMQRR